MSIQKKICILGAFAVGKTSLVARFVRGVYSDQYLTTVGVKIDKKSVDAPGGQLDMILWDLRGEDDFQSVPSSYLRGAAGYLLVADGTRAATLDTAVALQARLDDEIGDLPFALLLNKADLRPQWDLPDERLQELAARDWWLGETSAKTGAGVEEAFAELAGRLLPATTTS